MSRKRMAVAGAWIGVAVFVITGAWSFLAPHSFFDVLAPWRPYNRHLFHDVGAFQIGLGIAAAVALLRGDGTAVALSGLTSAGVLHTVSHVVDRGQGGRTTDPWTLGLLALLLMIALLVHLRRRST